MREESGPEGRRCGFEVSTLPPEPRPNLRLSAAPQGGESVLISGDWSSGGNWELKFSGTKRIPTRADEVARHANEAHAPPRSSTQETIDTSVHPSKSNPLLLKSQAFLDAVVPKIIE